MSEPARSEIKLFAPDGNDHGAKTTTPRRSRRLPKTLTANQSAQLTDFAVTQLDHEKIGRKRYGPCAAKVAAAARDLFAVQLGLGTGLRLAELCDLMIPDVELDAQQLIVTHGKGDKERYVPIPDDLVPVIREWIGARTAGHVITRDDGSRMSDVTMYWRIVRLGKRAKIPQRLHPHTLRHTYATRVYEATGDLRIVQELLGHESISTTQIYTHCTPGRMLAAVNSARTAGR